MIAEYLDCSTGHVDLDTATQLGTFTPRDRMLLDWPAMSIAGYDHGIFITVPDFNNADVQAQLLNLPHSLHQVLARANSLNCSLVRLDADGDEIDGLPTYEW